MRVHILKSFPFYPDGNTRHEAVAGSAADIPDALVAGLSAAGYISASPPASERHDHASLSVRHIGRGKYDLFRGDDRITHDAMTKDQAESALDAMTGA